MSKICPKIAKNSENLILSCHFFRPKRVICSEKWVFLLFFTAFQTFAFINSHFSRKNGEIWSKTVKMMKISHFFVHRPHFRPIRKEKENCFGIFDLAHSLGIFSRWKYPRTGKFVGRTQTGPTKIFIFSTYLKIPYLEYFWFS